MHLAEGGGRRAEGGGGRALAEPVQRPPPLAAVLTEKTYPPTAVMAWRGGGRDALLYILAVDSIGTGYAAVMGVNANAGLRVARIVFPLSAVGQPCP